SIAMSAARDILTSPDSTLVVCSKRGTANGAGQDPARSHFPERRPGGFNETDGLQVRTESELRQCVADCRGMLRCRVWLALTSGRAR
ncbi:MAG TPA: hypothetical protein VNO35_29025, partial [Steroidobacteraceae bacterium]|nr:hypothetical protein [Steroidobacteraceae bacterium]